MSKGYAFGFLIVLLVLVLGLYVAFTGFTSSREARQAQSASLSGTETARAGSAPTQPASSPTATALLIPTPVPGITATLTAMMPAVVTGSTPLAESPVPLPTDQPTHASTEPPAAPPSDTPAPPTQPPTPVPVPAYQFRLAGPPAADPSYQICCYIFGVVRDAAGNGLEGVRVQAFNEWNTLEPAATKGGGEMGQYNIPIGRDLVTWYVVVVDASGNQISSQVQIQFDPAVANGYRVDWQRAY